MKITAKGNAAEKDFAAAKMRIMDASTIDRINALARKSKNVGLTPEEKQEQAKLRQEYIAAIRMNVRTQLDNIDIQEADGTITNLGEKHRSRLPN